ncbi:MAG: hypothetical protein HXY39_11530 [Chloroflexi bacterium]|nr:hypothetical protein [Chloroflexota bacterium]
MSNTDITELSPIAYEQLIKQVRGVQGVRVVCSEDGQIDEVHVLGSPDRTPKAIVRDIESILMVRGGVRVSHRKISLVQVADMLVQQPRVQLLSVDSALADDRMRVTTVLGIGRRRVEGSAEGGRADAMPPDMLVGEAMVAALGQLLDPEVGLRIARIGRETFGTLEVCLAHLELQTAGGFETMLGISAVRSDPLYAMARAILDAINRRLPALVHTT